jgi:hypothetical protein
VSWILLFRSESDLSIIRRHIEQWFNKGFYTLFDA